MAKSVDLSTTLGPLTLPNPVMLASGTCSYGIEMEPYGDISRLGAVVVKGLSLNASPGNPPPRIVETPSGMLNSIGLENIGIKSFLRDRLPLLREKNVRVVVNIYGEKVEDYRRLAGMLDDAEGVEAIEANISCPNVKKGGLLFGQDGRATDRVVAAVRKATGKPLFVKLTPNVTDVREIARAAEGAGADALTLINTLQGMAIDVDTRRPALARVIGGLSGPAIRPVAVRIVWQVSQALSIPLIGVGGIHSARDALEFIIAGASAVQLGTVNFVYPDRWVDVLEGIRTYLENEGMASFSSLVGSLES